MHPALHRTRQAGSGAVIDQPRQRPLEQPRQGEAADEAASRHAIAASRLPGRIRIVADAVQRIIEVLEACPRDEWERRLRREFGGRSVYVSSATGRWLVQQLIAAGCAPRTARWKARGK